MLASYLFKSEVILVITVDSQTVRQLFRDDISDGRRNLDMDSNRKQIIASNNFSKITRQLAIKKNTDLSHCFKCKCLAQPHKHYEI